MHPPSILIDSNGDGDIKILNNFRTMFGQLYTHTNLNLSLPHIK